MTDAEALKLYEELVKEFGDKLPNFEHYPKTFAYFVKLYKHIKGNRNA